MIIEKKKETIWIDEPAAFMKSYGEIYDSVEGYQLMNDEKNGDVFLNSEKVIRGYKKSENEKEVIRRVQQNIHFFIQSKIVSKKKF